MRDSLPENTILAFEQSLKLGADGVEFDVQICGDGGLFVFHDTTLERMTEGRDHRRIVDVASSDLRRVHLGQGATIPRFRDVLNWANGCQPYLNIELKTHGDDTNQLVSAVEKEIEEIASAALMSRLLISSFDVAAISLAVAHNWLWPFAQLLGPEYQVQTKTAELARCGLHPHHSLVNSLDLTHFTNTGKFVNVWTVNTQSHAKELGYSTIDGMITDYPEIVRNALE